MYVDLSCYIYNRATGHEVSSVNSAGQLTTVVGVTYSAIEFRLACTQWDGASCAQLSIWSASTGHVGRRDTESTDDGWLKDPATAGGICVGSSPCDRWMPQPVNSFHPPDQDPVEAEQASFDAAAASVEGTLLSADTDANYDAALAIATRVADVGLDACGASVPVQMGIMVLGSGMANSGWFDGDTSATPDGALWAAVQALGSDTTRRIGKLYAHLLPGTLTRLGALRQSMYGGNSNDYPSQKSIHLTSADNLYDDSGDLGNTLSTEFVPGLIELPGTPFSTLQPGTTF